MTRRRIRIFDGVIKGYTVNQMSLHWWRLCATMTKEDFMQEAYALFLHVRLKYPHVSDAHFMSLYKTSLRNMITELSESDTKHRTVGTLSGLPNIYETAGDLDNNGYLRTLIRQAPPEIKAILAIFLNAPTEVLELAMSTWRQQGHYEAAGNKQVASWLGLDADATPLDDLYTYFSE